ncbi:hypothetical protein [Actinospica robiniae]|uniref:hypothetical protein n=1 Tax=Actinospica robiniae TaxID=304901 RepID=UPI001FDF32BD|nr:hypothetical protein [Actinospica robiniae]
MLTTAANQSWPSMAALATPVMRRSDVRERVPPHFLARLVERLPRMESPRLDEYFAMLDVVLMDRYLAQSEADSLVALATELQLDRATALNAHRYYLTSLARVALQDGIVAEAERTDLSAVAALLDLPADAVDDALALAQTLVDRKIPTAAPFALNRGDHVVLTGSMTKSREFWVERATSAGLVVQPYVTKRTRLVAAADPDSQSGKAVRARLYGIPIITEDAFGHMLDAL